MSEFELENPPIVEAVIDVRCELPSSFDASALHDAIPRDIRSRFPQSNERRQIEAQIKAGASVSSSDVVLGYILSTESRSKAVQFRLDGFSYSRLQSYSTFEEFSEEARELWDAYVRFSSPLRVSRIAGRFVNVIELDEGLNSFLDFAQVGNPYVTPPKALEGSLRSFRNSMTFDDRENDLVINVHSNLVQKSTGKDLGWMLDIDVFREFHDSPPLETLWDHLISIRHAKNLVFRDAIHEKQLKKFGLVTKND